MNPKDAEEYTQALGQVVAGGWRQIALGQRLGVPKALKLTVDQWVKQRLGGYVKYSIDERTAAIRTLAEDGFSEREIKGALGTGRQQVREALTGTKGTKYKQKLDGKKQQRGTENTKPLDVFAGLAISEAARAAADREDQRDERHDRRERKAAELRQAVNLPDAKYRVLYADPPWSYADKADAGSVQAGGAEQHYPSMSIEELCALPVAPVCEDNAVLFLWVTAPLLFDAFPVIEAWGFTYRASFIWDKVKHNMGHYNSVRHELLLIATRGSCPPDVRALIDSVQSIERTTHSTKPEAFRTIIDTLYPHGKRLELFARQTVAGWDSYGNEVLPRETAAG